jgi:hypothetical protein
LVNIGSPAKARNGVSISRKPYFAPKLYTYGNVHELTGGPSRGTPDGRSGGGGNNSMM